MVVAEPHRSPYCVYVQQIVQQQSLNILDKAKMFFDYGLINTSHMQDGKLISSGEQPTSKGYPYLLGSLIPALIERQAQDLMVRGPYLIYTVLADGDDTNDPVVDTARAILMVTLSRQQTQMEFIFSGCRRSSLCQSCNE